MLQPESAAICTSCCQHQIECILPAEGGALGYVENVENENPGHDGLVEELGQGMVHTVGGAAEPGPRHPDPGQHEPVVQAKEQGKRPGLQIEHKTAIRKKHVYYVPCPSRDGDRNEIYKVSSLQPLVSEISTLR